jgi:hypothetical protein
MEKAPLSRGEFPKELCSVSRRLFENRQGGKPPSSPRVLTMPFFSLFLIEFERFVLFSDRLLGEGIAGLG